MTTTGSDIYYITRAGMPGISYQTAGDLFEGVNYWTGFGGDTVKIDATKPDGTSERTTTILDTARKEGVDIIREFRATHPHIKTMLVSNYPEAQASAVAAGALPGFGKREIGSPRIGQVIRAALA